MKKIWQWYKKRSEIKAYRELWSEFMQDRRIYGYNFSDTPTQEDFETWLKYR